MRLIILALLLALALGSAHAYPLQGGNENLTAVLFGATRTPLDDENATQEILKLDVGLVGAQNASFELVESKDGVYQPGLYRTLQPGRMLVYFLIPQDSLFKRINITPTSGTPFDIKWWATPKGMNQDLVIRYYGIIDWLINPDEQGIVLQLRLTNNGTENLTIVPENFTLIDQWNWIYHPTLGFDPMVIEPGNPSPSRVKLGFTGLSFLSRPGALAYDYGTEHGIVIDLEKDQGQLTDVQVYGANATRAAAPAAAPAASPAINQSEKQPQNQSASVAAASQTGQIQKKENTTARMGSLKEQIAASKAKLELARADLKKNNTAQ